MAGISIGQGANLGNAMFRYMYCMDLLRMVPGCDFYSYNLPEFGLIQNRKVHTGRQMLIKGGHEVSKDNLAYLLNNGLYDTIRFLAFVQRMEYYPDRLLCSSYFRNRAEVDTVLLGEKHITLNVRAAEVLGSVHKDYGPVPISFYEHVVEQSGLEPVLMGQIGDNDYSRELLRRFSGCPIMPSVSAGSDFEIIRRSRNIAVSTSSFSWLAGWLAYDAKQIFLPLNGFMNPDQRNDVNLVPLRDERYRFYSFPVSRWSASSSQLQTLLDPARPFHELSRREAIERFT